VIDDSDLAARTIATPAASLTTFEVGAGLPDYREHGKQYLTHLGSHIIATRMLINSSAPLGSTPGRLQKEAEGICPSRGHVMAIPPLPYYLQLKWKLLIISLLWSVYLQQARGAVQRS
jgi:hypothetical protein